MTLFGRRGLQGLAAGLLLVLPGCERPGAGPGGHSHERGKLKITDAGGHHGLLTAHLAPSGNELDVFFETSGEDPKPVAIAAEPFAAQARAGEGEWKELRFEPAPADERPKDEKPGTCSHFIAKAPWIQPSDTLHVVAKVKMEGVEETVEWKKFEVARFAHEAGGK
ncbi:MAG: hypothetical protein HY721_14970 [Planctomycetes bacterium]|nr:hypothetical protein [Planctomycetota bacterium]